MWRRVKFAGFGVWRASLVAIAGFGGGGGGAGETVPNLVPCLVPSLQGFRSQVFKALKVPSLQGLCPKS